MMKFSYIYIYIYAYYIIEDIVIQAKLTIHNNIEGSSISLCKLFVN